MSRPFNLIANDKIVAIPDSVDLYSNEIIYWQCDLKNFTQPELKIASLTDFSKLFTPNIMQVLNECNAKWGEEEGIDI